MTNTPQPLRIDIVSDVMCPWCIIGYQQLKTALDSSGVEHDIHWHPFELNPDMPPEGQDMGEHLAQKYGTTPEQSAANRANMIAMGQELGFTFAFPDGFRMHNTFNAHQLLHWADERGRRNDLKLALFAAHFTDGRDLSDDAVLVQIAAETGLDAAQATTVLAQQTYAAAVRQEQQFWAKQGISSVPSVIFDRQHLVTGAQGVETYKSILVQLQQLAQSA